MQHLFSSQHIIRKTKLDSTNNYALKLLSETNPVNGTVVLTANQTKGRGQRKNYWESENGKNLTISIILRPEFLPVHLQFGISKVISLGVVDFLSQYINDVTIKWPNDIYVGDEKIAGILIEHSIMGATLAHSVCGIGLNVNQTVFVSDAPNPTSMAIQKDRLFDLEESLWGLLKSIENRYCELERGEQDRLDADYLNVLYRSKGYFPFSDENGTFEACIKGITEIGQLILSSRSGEERIYNFKEVSFIL